MCLKQCFPSLCYKATFTFRWPTVISFGSSGLRTERQEESVGGDHFPLGVNPNHTLTDPSVHPGSQPPTCQRGPDT